jgi:hypothetical protein
LPIDLRFTGLEAILDRMLNGAAIDPVAEVNLKQ